MTLEGEPLVFSIIVNGFRVPTAGDRCGVDKALLRLVQFQHQNHLP